MRFSAQRDQRGTPARERFAACGGAVVGKGIEREIGARVVASSVDREFARELRGSRFSLARVPTLENQARTRSRTSRIERPRDFKQQSVEPGTARRICDQSAATRGESLATLLKQQKTSASSFCSRGIADRSARQAMISSSRKPQEAFAIERVAGTDRISDGIGDSPADRADAGGVGIPEPAQLHWRGMAREDGEAVPGGVPRQIDQQIDLVGFNLLRERRIGRAEPCRETDRTPRAAAL